MWKYGFIKKDVVLNLRLSNKIKQSQNCSSLASARDLVRIFFSHPLGDSHQVRTVITVERLIVFDLLLLAIYTPNENSQVVAYKQHWPGDSLPERRVWPEYDFSTFAKFLRA